MPERSPALGEVAPGARTAFATQRYTLAAESFSVQVDEGRNPYGN